MSELYTYQNARCNNKKRVPISCNFLKTSYMQFALLSLSYIYHKSVAVHHSVSLYRWHWYVTQQQQYAHRTRCCFTPARHIVTSNTHCMSSNSYLSYLIPWSSESYFFLRYSEFPQLWFWGCRPSGMWSCVTGVEVPVNQSHGVISQGQAW